MLLHGPLQQELFSGQSQRTDLSRKQWIASLRRRIAAAPKDVSLAVSGHTAMVSAGQQAATKASRLGGAVPNTQGNRSSTRLSHGHAALQSGHIVAEQQQTPLGQPASSLQHAAAAEGSALHKAVQLHPAIRTAVPGSIDSGSPTPESPAAALKQRRLAAAAAKQHEAAQTAEAVAHSNRHTPYSSRDGAMSSQQLRRNRQPRLPRMSQSGLQGTHVPPTLQQVLQQVQVQQRLDSASDLSSHLYEPHEHSKQQLSQQYQQQLSSVASRTQLIQRTDHPRQLVQILVAGASSLNAVHITAAAEALLRFVNHMQHMRGDDQQVEIYMVKTKVAYKHLCKVITAELLDLDTRAVISLLRCFSKMAVADQFFLPQQLWGDLLHISANMMDRLSPQQLAMMVYAVAQADRCAKAKPSRRWWMLFFEVSQDNMSNFTPQGYANMVWAMGKLQRRPGAEWAAALYEATEPQLGLFTPQGLANLGSGLGHMNGLGLSGLPRPSQRWMRAYLVAAVQQLEGFTSQGLANLLWALARLGYCPPKDGIKALTNASLALLQRSTAQDLSLMVYSFAVLKAKLPESWWNRFWPMSANQLEQGGSQALANTFYALGKHRRVPPSFWLLAFLPAMQSALPQCSSQAVANVLWAAGQLRLTQLPGGWIDFVLGRVYQQLPDAKPVELSVVLLALKRMQHPPSQKWLDRFFAASHPKLASFTAPQLSGVVESLGLLTPNCSPPLAWSSAVVAQVSARLPTMRAPESTAVIWGLCELRIAPSKDMLSRFMAVSTENLHLMDGAMLSRTLRTLVRLGQKPNADWLLLLVEESYYHLSLLQPQHLADFAWSFGQLRYSPGPSWISRVLEAASHQLPGFKSAALVRLLQGLAGLQLKPGVEWLGAVGYRVQQLLGEMTAQELLQSVAALERLGSGPGALLMQQLSAGSFKSAAAPQPLAQTAVGSGGVRSSQVPSSPPPAVPEGVASDGASADVPAGAAVCAVPAEDHASAGSMQVIMRPQLQQQRAAVAAELAVVSASTREAQQITPHCTSPETTAANSSIASQLQRLAQQDGLEQGAYRLEADFAAELAAGSLRRSPDDWLDLALAGVGVEEQMGHSQNQAVILLPRPERPRRAPSGLQRPLAACR